MDTSQNTHDPERARDALFYIEPSCRREEWVRIGMAAKAAGLSFDAFHEWSAGGENYKSQRDCISVWRSFKETGGITPATLYDEAFRQGWKYNSTAAHLKPAPVSHIPPDPIKKPDNPALQTWAICTEAPPDNPYIIRKHGQPDDLRVYPVDAPPLIIDKQEVAGWLAVPVWFEGQLQTIQFIPPNIGGKKLNHPSASTNYGYFTVGNLPDNPEYSGEICIVEGIGQAWASNQAMGAPAVSCFGAGRMAKIAEVLRRKYPNAKLVVVPDRGKEAAAAKIASAVYGYWVEMPSEKPSNYDVNDYLLEYGLESLADLLSKILEPQPANQEPQSDHESVECVMTSTIEPFPGLMTEVVNSALVAAHKPQKELTILSVLLGMSSTCTGEYILPGGDRLNLYGTGIAGTGCGKDHPRNVAESIAGAGCCQVIGQPGSGEGFKLPSAFFNRYGRSRLFF